MRSPEEELAALRIYKLMMDGQQPAGAARLSAGVVRLGPAVPPENFVTPNTWQFLVEWASPVASTVEWQVQLDSGLHSGFFPDGSGHIPFIAAAWDWVLNAGVIVRVECGSGPTARTFYCDLRSGRFALGVQERVRISIARWLAPDASGRVVVVQSTLGPAQASDAECPTYTAKGNTVGPSKSLPIPPGAQWFDFTSGNPVTVLVGGFEYARDTVTNPLAPVIVPGPGPYPVPAGATHVDFFWPGGFGGAATVIFWVR